MCGIAGIFGKGDKSARLSDMIACQTHRGPDGTGLYISPTGTAGLGHNRLSIIDLSDAARQPMSNRDGRLWLSFNGEVYNYLELRKELGSYRFRSDGDGEVVLAAYERWGKKCLDRFIGMFAFMVWDEDKQQLFAARDRFGVKPLYYSQTADEILIASEIKALHAAGVPAVPDEVTWATYLTTGVHENTERTFWKGINCLPAGHSLTWANGELKLQRWYDLAKPRAEHLDQRPLNVVKEEYFALLQESIKLRFRSDVPVGINLSGGLDSSILLGLVQAGQGDDSSVAAFSFITGDANYDELPWVEQMLAQTKHPLNVASVRVDDVPDLAASVQAYQDEPFGGLPTLCYARLFETARANGVKVLLDGQGMDEQWAGYDYYASAKQVASSVTVVQGTRESHVRSECLVPEFRRLSTPLTFDEPFADTLRNLQYRDAQYTKIPRALRYNDRVSMRSSTELREPFLDHRLFELALNQPAERKIAQGMGKWLLREIARDLLPNTVRTASKRPLQTPQREWLRGPLREWAHEQIELALRGDAGQWFDRAKVRQTWQEYCGGIGDNSFYIWQWINLGLMTSSSRPVRLAA